jgi:exosortase K
MEFKKNLLYYLCIATLFILLKQLYTFADNESLKFLLVPTNKLVALFQGSSYSYSANGYYHESLNILINKSCSGFNFMILSFLVFSITFSRTNYSNKIKYW